MNTMYDGRVVLSDETEMGIYHKVSHVDKEGNKYVIAEYIILKDGYLVWCKTCKDEQIHLMTEEAVKGIIQQINEELIHEEGPL